MDVTIDLDKSRRDKSRLYGRKFTSLIADFRHGSHEDTKWEGQEPRALLYSHGRGTKVRSNSQENPSVIIWMVLFVRFPYPVHPVYPEKSIQKIKKAR